MQTITPVKRSASLAGAGWIRSWWPFLQAVHAAHCFANPYPDLKLHPLNNIGEGGGGLRSSGMS